MSKRQTRIQMGPSGPVYLLTTMLILGAAIYTQANLLFWGFGLMVGGLVVSVVITTQTLRGLEVQRLLPTHGVAGEQLALRYHVTNRSRLPMFSLLITENWGRGMRGWRKSGPIAAQPQRLRGQPFGWLLHVGPQQSIQAETSCWPLQRGVLPFERIVIFSTFPFGVIRKVVEFHQPAQLLIYPRLHRMNRRVIGALSQIDPSGRRQIDRGGGSEEFFGLRDYRVGDSLKMVDWKRTARTGSMVARELTQPCPPRIMVLLDLIDQAQPSTTRPPHKPKGSKQHSKSSPHTDRITKLPLEEHAINLAASVICDAYFRGYQVGLVVGGAVCSAFGVHHSLPHRTRMLEALAHLDTAARCDVSRGLAATASVIICCTTTRASSLGRSSGQTILCAANIKQYVVSGDSQERGVLGAGLDMLSRQTGPRRRREELDEAKQRRWTVARVD